MRIKAENQKNSVSLSNNEIHTSGIGSDTINNVVKATNNLAEYWANQAEGSAKKAKQSEENASISAENASKSEINVNNALEEVKTIANGFDEHVVVKTNEFDEHTVTKQGEFDTHVTEKQNDFDVNALTLIARYDNNDLARTKAFNKNAEEKQALVDASVDLARKAANGTIEEYPNGSAEYWAGKAEEAASGKVIDDTIVATDKTYSSSKIEAELEKKKNKTITILKNPINDGYYLEGNENANTIYNYVYGDKTSVELAFDDIITNTGEQIYPFETFDKDRNAIFRRNIITKDKVERINIKVNYQGTVTFEPVQFEAGSGLPVGTIFAHSASSTFVPENSLPCDGMEYSKDQFKALYNDFLVLKRLETCTYEEYQQEITATGECLKFGLDTAQGKFKVPTKINEYVSPNGGGKAPVSAGEPHQYLYSITNKYITFAHNPGEALNFTDNDKALSIHNDAMAVSNLQTGLNTPNIKFDNLYADLSNAIKTKEIRYFVVVATGSIKQSEMDWSQWASSLQGKANIDGDNFSKVGKELISGMGMPSEKEIYLSLGASGTIYTAITNGYFQAHLDSGTIQMNTFGTSIRGKTTSADNPNVGCNLMFEARKGEQVQMVYAGQGSPFIKFIYAEGSKGDE